MTKWYSISEDDFTAIIGDYTLRVEQMDVDYWWWCVYCKNDRIDGYSQTEKGAKRMATNAYNKIMKNKE